MSRGADVLPVVVFYHHAHGKLCTVADALAYAESRISEIEDVPALEVFRIAGGDTECNPTPTAADALECLRDLRACYDQALAAFEVSK